MIVNAVRAVLSGLDEQGEADYEDWDEQLRTQMETLEASYRVLRNVNRDLIDYSDLAAQTAYLYRYVIGHADFIYQLLSRARAKSGSPLFSDTELWVTSIGGGPGSELLGLLKYLAEGNGEPEVSTIVYTVFDKEENWEHVVEAIAEAAEADIKIDIAFKTFDASAVAIPEGVEIDQEDIVIMSFFISEVCSIPNGHRVCNNVKSLLGTMKNNSLLVYNDSSAYSFYSFFNARVAAAKGFSEIVDVDEELRADCPQYEGIFADFQERFGYGFKLASKAVAKVLRRTVA